ncbi:hypothetical protein FA95DRAFT_1565161 [Auriscalpium vulgare]|uniref:Uncharacterized protein n=1 Tax=Auriscalpium vulgare TaxID=40419 RepID=A0ACB8RDK4_9AGAM|nr:hypothetical protein FA95DRAFT_1565161 [Auriscalpium vulgare]
MASLMHNAYLSINSSTQQPAAPAHLLSYLERSQPTPQVADMPLPLSPQTALRVPYFSTNAAYAESSAAPQARGDITAALPNETLLHIFSFLCRSYPVSSVSRRWREVACAIPHLWLVEINLGLSRGRERLAQAATSSPRPLFIFHRDGGKLEDIDMDLISEHLFHTHTLEFTQPERFPVNLLRKLIRPAPLLEELFLWIDGEYPVDFLGNHAPRLKNLSLRGVFGISWTSPIFRGIVELRVHFPYRVFPPNHPEAGPEHCEKILDGLENMRSLKTLFFKYAARIGHHTEAHVARPNVRLPNLTLLAIIGDHPECCLHLLTHIEVAPTTCLQFNMYTSHSALLIWTISRNLSIWEQAAARQTRVYFKPSNGVDSGDMRFTVDRKPSSPIVSRSRNFLDLYFKSIPGTGGVSELARLAWWTITWGTIEELVLEDLPRNAEGLPQSWWGVLKSARCLRKLVARGMAVELVLEFLTTEDVCLQRGQRDTVLPALEELQLEYALGGGIWEPLSAEMQEAFGVWLKDREKVGCPLKTLDVNEILPDIEYSITT